MDEFIAGLRQLAAGPHDFPSLPFSAYRQFGDTGYRLDYERLFVRRRARLVTLGAIALLDPESNVDALMDVIWSTCDEYTWALPAHVSDAVEHGWGADQCVDLLACETAHCLAEIVARLGDRLDVRVAARVRTEIDRRVFTPFEDARPLPWEGFGNNWEAVCAGAAGLAALAMLADGDRLSRFLARCRSAMDRFLSGYGDDGGCPEGIEYWVYGFSHFVYFAEALRGRTGEDLLSVPKVAQIAAFPQRVALGGGAYVPFSDASSDPFLPPGLMSFLAKRFGTAGPAAPPSIVGERYLRWGHLTRTLAWYEPAPQLEAEESSYLPDLAWVIDRGKYAFAAKGGHNNESHNHIDLGHFIVRVNGVNVLDDLGAGQYTRAYFREGRYEALHPSAAGHSIPVVDGHYQLDGPSRTAKVLCYEQTDDGVRFELDLTAAYEAGGLVSLVRRFDWQRGGRLVLVDEVIGTREIHLEELFVSRREPSIMGDEVRWAGLLRMAHAMAASVETIETTDHFGQPEMVYRLRLRTSAPAGKSAHRLVFEVTD